MSKCFEQSSEKVETQYMYKEMYEHNHTNYLTDPLFIRDDFDSMMKAIEEDIKCSSQLEQGTVEDNFTH